MIDQLLSGTSIEDIEIPYYNLLPDDIICIANNEFYILKKDDKIIDAFIIKKCENNKNVVELFEKILGGNVNEENRSYH